MKVKISQREGKRKSEISQMRHKGDIPGVIYAKGVESELICVNGADFHEILRNLKKGHLPTTVFELEDGKTRTAIVKDIQYHPVTYNVLHVDFMLLQDKIPVKAAVPVECTGVADCAGIKLGGFLRQVSRHVKVNCLPKDLPKKFEVDVRNMAIGHSKRISDVAMPEGVKPLVDKQTVLVAIAKR